MCLNKKGGFFRIRKNMKQKQVASKIKTSANMQIVKLISIYISLKLDIISAVNSFLVQQPKTVKLHSNKGQDITG